LPEDPSVMCHALHRADIVDLRVVWNGSDAMNPGA
jgi:hypothetical protein